MNYHERQSFLILLGAKVLNNFYKCQMFMKIIFDYYFIVYLFANDCI